MANGIDVSSPCILWNRAINRLGYGRVWDGRSVDGAHRVAYKKAKGDIPKGYHIHHVCNNKSCVNPLHLEAVTQLEHRHIHGLAGIALEHSISTVCRNGHSFDGFNGRQRTCSICSAKTKHEHYLRNKEQFSLKSKKWKMDHPDETRESNARYRLSIKTQLCSLG